MPRAKVLQFIAEPPMERRVVTMAKKLRTTRAGVLELAVETLLDHLEAGDAVVQMGKVVFLDNNKAAAR